jgi:hypothetical protein
LGWKRIGIVLVVGVELVVESDRLSTTTTRTTTRTVVC